MTPLQGTTIDLQDVAPQTVGDSLKLVGARKLANVQVAPYPRDLERILERFEYKPGWSFTLKWEDRGEGRSGLTLNVQITGYDTYDLSKGDRWQVMHPIVVPAEAWGWQAWQRWLLDTILDIERHEACEFFKVGGVRVFAPDHTPDRNLYTINERASDERD